MREELVVLETAKLAKEKGFNVPVWDYFQVTCSKQPSECCTPTKSNWNTYNEYEVYSRPSQSLLQRWLREVHDIEVLISRIPPEAVLASKANGKNILRNYNCYVWNLNSNPRIANKGSFRDTYEEALELGLQETLKLIN